MRTRISGRLSELGETEATIDVGLVLIVPVKITAPMHMDLWVDSDYAGDRRTRNSKTPRASTRGSMS